MLRFSPGSPGLASPAGEEPPPRSLGPKPETHTLISQYSIVTFAEQRDSSKGPRRRQGVRLLRENPGSLDAILMMSCGGRRGESALSPFAPHPPSANGRCWGAPLEGHPGHPYLEPDSDHWRGKPQQCAMALAMTAPMKVAVKTSARGLYRDWAVSNA
jgi:hypothetical protein